MSDDREWLDFNWDEVIPPYELETEDMGEEA